jgi:hypothetical protein
MCLLIDSRLEEEDGLKNIQISTRDDISFPVHQVTEADGCLMDDLLFLTPMIVASRIRAMHYLPI